MNRLQDLGYRVQVVETPSALAEKAKDENPLILITDLAGGREEVLTAIQAVRSDAATSHVPILAYVEAASAHCEAAARESGANLVAIEQAFLVQLPQLLDQVLELN